MTSTPSNPGPDQRPTRQPDTGTDSSLDVNLSFPPLLVRDLKSLYENTFVLPSATDQAIRHAARARLEDLRRRRMRLVFVRTAGAFAAAAALALAVFVALPKAPQGGPNRELALNKSVGPVEGRPGQPDVSGARSFHSTTEQFGAAASGDPLVGSVTTGTPATPERTLAFKALPAGRVSGTGGPGGAIMPGDLNQDRKVDIVDALLLARSLDAAAVVAVEADFNGDGVIDRDDVKAIAQAAVHLRSADHAAIRAAGWGGAL